jgi:DnaJ-domain-containing protein 1
VLLQRGLVDPGRLRRCANQLMVVNGARFGDLLLQSRALSEVALDEALRLQRNERLERLFELEDARLAFHVARVYPGRDALSPPAFLQGRRRFRDRPVSGHVRNDAHQPPARRDPARARALSTLGLDAGADPATVKRAFRELARSLHPDRHPDATLAQRADLMRRFAEITAAYHALVA